MVKWYFLPTQIFVPLDPCGIRSLQGVELESLFKMAKCTGETGDGQTPSFVGFFSEAKGMGFTPCLGGVDMWPWNNVVSS